MKIEIGYDSNNEFYQGFAERVSKRQPDDPDKIWIVTYTKETYSVGMDDPAYKNPPSEIHGVPVLAMPRGGSWSWHGPGQTALIMELNFARIMQDPRPSAVKNIRVASTINRNITKIIGKICNIECKFNNQDPGIYTTEGAKLGSMGWNNISDTYSLYNWSFNINIANDFAGFGKIDVCGVKDRPMANLMPQCGQWGELQYRQFGKIVVDKLIPELYNNIEDLEILS